jgi:hypothetical protein
MRTVIVRRNADDTITVRVSGCRVEYISTHDKTKSQVFDAVKYALITQKVLMTDIEITRLLGEY